MRAERTACVAAHSASKRQRAVTYVKAFNPAKRKETPRNTKVICDAAQSENENTRQSQYEKSIRSKLAKIKPLTKHSNMQITRQLRTLKYVTPKYGSLGDNLCQYSRDKKKKKWEDGRK